MLDEVSTRKGEFKTYSFIVNKRSPYINAKMNVKIKPREKDYFTWDEKLTLEFTGAAPSSKEYQGGAGSSRNHYLISLWQLYGS